MIAAISSGYELSPRRIVRSDPQGRFRIDRMGQRGATSVVHLCAFKEGMAPAVLETEILRGPPLDDLKVVLARARPFVGVVQQSRQVPVGGAAVKVRSMRVPVIEGAGTTIVDIPWRIISGTPLEKVLQTVTDEKGQFRFEYCAGSVGDASGCHRQWHAAAATVRVQWPEIRAHAT